MIKCVFYQTRCCWQKVRKDRGGSALKLQRWRWSWENGERKRKRNPLFSLSWISSFLWTSHAFKSRCHSLSSLSPPALFALFASFSCFFSCFFSFLYCLLWLLSVVSRPSSILSFSQLLSFRLFLFLTFFILVMFLIVSMRAFLFFSLSVTPTQALLWCPGFRWIKVLSFLNFYNNPTCPCPVFHCHFLPPPGNR